MDKFEETIGEEVRPLMEGYVLNASIVDELDHAGDLAEVFAVLQFLETKIKARKEVIRNRLLNKAEATGRETDMGGQRIQTDFGSITRERRVSRMPEEDLIKLAMAERGVSVKDAFSDKVTAVLDVSKLEALIARGRLPPDTITKAQKVTWALKFKPTALIAEKMEEMVPKGED